MKKVVYVGYELEDGRAPHQAMGAIWLALNGHDVTFLTRSNKSAPKWVGAIKTLTYKAFGGSRRSSSVKLARQLRSLLLQQDVDFCYVQGAQNAALTFWVPFLLPKQKLVYHTQDFKPYITRFYSWAERILSRRCDLVICNEINRAKVMELFHGLSQTPAVIRTSLPEPWHIPEGCGMRASLLSRIPSIRRDGAIFIAAGGPFMPRRKSRELVQALAHLGDEFHLVFTGMPEGSDRMRDCRKCAEDAGVADRIVFLERLEYFDLLSLYSSCDIGVLLYCDTDLANFYQGPGRVTEYMRSGIPFVTSDYPGLELLVLKYGAGAVADPNSPKDIARALETLKPVNDRARAETARRLMDTARSVLSYEQGARAVLGKYFSEDPNYANHTFWSTIASEEVNAVSKCGREDQ